MYHELRKRGTRLVAGLLNPWGYIDLVRGLLGEYRYLVVMKRLAALVLLGVFALPIAGNADGYGRYPHYRRHVHWRHGHPFYDAEYISAVQHLGYRGRRYNFAGPAYAFGDPSYGGCRLGHELVPTWWGAGWARVRLCSAGSGRY